MRVAGMVAVALGCAPAMPRPPTKAPNDVIVVGEQLPAQRRFAPASPAVAAYADLTAMPPRDALDEHVLEELQKRSVAQRPMHLDAALSRACAELAIEPDDRGFSTGLVDFALQRHGIVEPSPRIIVVWGDPARPELLAAALRPKLSDEDLYAPALRIGIGVGAARDGVVPVVVAVLGTRISIAPIPRMPPTGARIAVDARMDERLREPRVTVHREDGRVERPTVVARGGRSSTTIICDDVPATLRVDITAQNASGPTTIASFPLYCGLTPPREYYWERAEIGETADLERRLVALIDRDRRAANAPPLAVDADAMTAARAHARDPRREPTVPGAAYSAIAASDLRAAYEALANGRAGREHLLAATSTHLGVGVARGADGVLRASVIYRRVPPAIDTAAATRTITAQITAWLKLEAYPPLVAIANRFVDELVAGIPQPEAWEDMRWWLQDIHYRVAHLNYSLAYVPQISLTTRDALLGPRTIDMFGVAVRQADHPRFGPRTIWIVVVYAERK